jgi:membrane-associated phospholipid phosphatase
MQKLGHIISTIFQPLLIPTYGLLLLFQAGLFTYTQFNYKLFTVISIFILTAIIPLTTILILKKVGVVSSVALSESKERTLPYLFAIFSYIAALIFLWRIYMPVYIVAMMAGCVLATALVTIINIKWKISAHLCAMGSLCAAIMVVSFRLGINSTWILAFSFIAAGFVSMARIVLGVHTPLQTIAGFALGFILIASFGMINIAI